MKRLLAAVLFIPSLAAADEVLVTTAAAARVDPAKPLIGRRSIEVQNNGPNGIACQPRSSTELTA
jgi:hypothetical protein